MSDLGKQVSNFSYPSENRPVLSSEIYLLPTLQLVDSSGPRRIRMVRFARFAALLCALAVAVPAAAQVQTGSILVRATDAQGAVVPGATVTISSPVLVAGSAVGVTDTGGVYRFPSLVPG